MPSTIATKIRLRRCGLIMAPLDDASRYGAAWVATADGVLGFVIPAFPSASDANGSCYGNGMVGTPASLSSRAGTGWGYCAEFVRGPHAHGNPRFRPSARRARNALRRVQLFAELVHQLELRLEGVDVQFPVGHDLLQQDGAVAVLLLAAHDDSGPKPVQDLVLYGEIRLELLAQRLPDT